MTEKQPDNYSGWGPGIAIGLGVGISLGVALDNIGAGIAIGMGIGIAFAVVFTEAAKKKGQQPPESEDS